MDMEEIVYHTLFFVGIVSSLGIIFYYRRTVRALISASLFFISFVCTFPAMYIVSVSVELLEKNIGYSLIKFPLMFIYIWSSLVISGFVFYSQVFQN